MRANDVEHEANLFALYLLMPRDLLMREILKKKYFDLTSDDDMKDICKTFGVTQVALAVRLGLLTDNDKRLIGFK